MTFKLKKKQLVILLFTLIAGFCVGWIYKVEIKHYLIKQYKAYHQNKIIKNTNPEDYYWGIDLSHHQKNVNWEILVSENKPDFIFLKATEGSTHTDTRYKTYKKKAEALDLTVGAYHFFSYSSPGKQQAEHFIKTAALSKGNLIPVLDVEFTRNKTGTREQIVNEIKAFCNAIYDYYGVYPIIYCACDYRKKYLNDSFFNDFTFWISDLWRKPTCSYTIWQYTDQGPVKGIGNIDNNRISKQVDFKTLLLN